MALVICPIAFGVVVANLSGDISDVWNTRVTIGNATIFPPSDITCMTWPSSISKRVSNVASFRVNGNMSAALEFQTEYDATKPTGTKKCTCSQDGRVTYKKDNVTAVIAYNDPTVDCNRELYWTTRNTTVYIYWADNDTYSIEYQSPGAKVQILENEIRGFIIGIFVCCGFLGFIMVASCLHCLSSRRRDRVYNDQTSTL